MTSLPAKTAVGGVNLPLSPLASLLSTPWPPRQVQAVILELFHPKNGAPTGAGGPAQIFVKGLSRAKLSAMSWWPVI